VTFQTNDGFRNPAELQALPVPGRHMRILNVTTAVPRLEQLAGTITARSGRVVVDRLQSFDGSDPNHPSGLAVTLAAPASSQVWAFGEGLITDGLNENYTLLNASDRPVNAEVDITLADPATNGEVDPITIAVPSHGYTQIVMRDQTRVLPNVPHSVTVRTSDAAGLVVERVVTGAAPAPHRGYEPSLGSPLVATQWVFADGASVTGERLEVVTVVNLSSESPARIKFSALAQGQLLEIDGLQSVEVPPGTRLAIDVGHHVQRADLALVVESDRPVAVERGLYGKDATGSLAFGLPFPETAVLPPLHRA
jgi:hypothetical protein